MSSIFNPHNIAVIGVSESQSNIGKNIIHNLTEFQFKGQVYLVGKSGGSVYGQPILRSVHDIPGKIDLAMILIRADYVPDIAVQCGEKGISVLVIGSAGFSESGPKGADLEYRLKEICNKYGMRIVGPNCMGLVNMHNGLCLPFTIESRQILANGPVGIIGQSGTIAMDYARHLSKMGLGVSKIASIGNKLDLDEVDFLEDYLQDDETQIVYLYLESFSRGRAFFELARTAKKPIIVHKSNTSEFTQAVATSHTNALAANDMIVNSVLRQSGVIRVQDLDDFINCLKVLQLPRLKGNRLAVISLGGYAADECHRKGFVLQPLPSDFKVWLKENSGATVLSAINPIVLDNPHIEKIYPKLFAKLSALPNIDGILYDIGHTPVFAMLREYSNWFRQLNGICLKSKKPIYIRMPIYNTPVAPEITRHLKVPFFKSTTALFEAIRKVTQAHKMS